MHQDLYHLTFTFALRRGLFFGQVIRPLARERTLASELT
jgi:hypothetical protein